MIATHNTMTYLPAHNPLVELFSSLWRCQGRTLQEQIQQGVRVFDIRVAYSRKHGLCFAHGLATLQDRGEFLASVINRLEKNNCWYRIVLERDDTELKEYFNEWLDYMEDNFPHCFAIIVKKNWRVLWQRNGFTPQVVDNSFVPFVSDKPWYKQLSWKMFSTPKRWAKKHQPTAEEWADNETIYYYDWV
jgi:hypothetical protein